MLAHDRCGGGVGCWCAHGQAEHRSPRYTTRWDELPVVR
ncbi:MAG: DUF4113 domain-containing protein [Burkholderiaceae bacterium]|nr:DUF4113 domain-containing protein [Burkholderiaceae bacterium]